MRERVKPKGKWIFSSHLPMCFCSGSIGTTLPVLAMTHPVIFSPDLFSSHVFIHIVVPLKCKIGDLMEILLSEESELGGSFSVFMDKPEIPFVFLSLLYLLSEKPTKPGQFRTRKLLPGRKTFYLLIGMHGIIIIEFIWISVPVFSDIGLFSIPL